MRLSRFVLTFRDAAPGEHVLYDVVTDSYLGVDDRALSAIARWGRAPPAPGEEAESAEALRSLGFLVERDEDDVVRLEGAERAAAEGQPGTMHVTLLPTLACNLACTYCIQRDQPRSGSMSASTEEAMLAWLKRGAAASRPARLTIQYLGGEPLLRKDLVLRTAERLAGLARSLGIPFRWGIATNGLLLDVSFAKAMAAHGPGHVTVTLDGDRETHDAARVRRDGQGTFDEVLGRVADVARACPEVAVRVNGNFLEGQRASFERLLERLEAEGLTGHLAEVSFQPVVEAAGCAAACGPGAESEAVVQLGRRATERGLSRAGAGGIDAIAPCELHWDRAWVVDTEGRLYRCFGVAGRPELAIGDVRSGPTRPDPLRVARPWEACGQCAFLPVCLGGCIGGRYAADGVFAVDCQRPSFELRFREEVVRRYLEEFHPAPEGHLAP